MATDAVVTAADAGIESGQRSASTIAQENREKEDGRGEADAVDRQACMHEWMRCCMREEKEKEL